MASAPAAQAEGAQGDEAARGAPAARDAAHVGAQDGAVAAHEAHGQPPARRLHQRHDRLRRRRRRLLDTAAHQHAEQADGVHDRAEREAVHGG